MQTAFSSPRPYLLNRAGGIVQIRSFSLVGTELKVDAVSDRPLTGIHHLVYRCSGHDASDVKRAVSSDGETWSLLDQLPSSEDCDVCYPESCS